MIIASCVHSCQWQLFVVLELCTLYTAKFIIITIMRFMGGGGGAITYKAVQNVRKFFLCNGDASCF